MIYLFLITLLVLFFAWYSYHKNDEIEDDNETLVYMQGNNPDDDSDADMQEQYAYENEKNERDK